MGTGQYDSYVNRKFDDSTSVFEQLSSMDKEKMLSKKQTFETLQLRDKTIDMIDMLYWYLQRDPLLQKFRIVDIGVGGGWIPILLAKQAKNHKKDFIQELHGVDIDDKALVVSASNADVYGVQLMLHKGNFLEPLANIMGDNNAANLVISANLPYNTDEERETYDEYIRSEPKHAIVGGGEDGLNMFREFLSQFLQHHGYVHMLMLQGSSSNAPKLLELCKELGIPGMHFVLEKDISGKDRFVLGLRSPQHIYECPQL